tara:strand:- start:49246 stop:50376 length:1131 start_codon:yes stop_codon:yes gene_type:complete
MKKTFLLLAFLIINIFSYSQCNGRYETEIFNSVTVTEVNYSDIYNDDRHLIDIYTPNGDTEINRPLIIFAHGGSFMGGEKDLADCVDFCSSFAKKGYVTASANYRLVSPADQQDFIFYQEKQYEAILKAVSDIKSAIRYFRKDFTTNNTYGIDTSTIFIAGSSAGAVTMLHLAYIDAISDLPTSVTDVLGNTFNPHNIVSSLGGSLEGDAGNYGFSSKVSGVISFAGGINNVNWIDSEDEPLVSIQGDADQTVSFNCSYGMGFPTIVELCGSGEMHPQANTVNLNNDMLVLPGSEHDWFPSGSSDARFVDAIEFTSTFLYPLLPCNQSTSVSEINKTKKELMKITDLLGRNTIEITNTPLLYIYNDGSVEHKIIIQ